MTKRTQAERKPSLKPQDITPTVCYYENPKALDFIVECREIGGAYHQTLRFKVPRRKLIASLGRMGVVCHVDE